MKTFVIKSHTNGMMYNQPHLFILNKGINSGKPQKEAFANCFVLIFSDTEDAESIFWLAQALYKSKFWHQLLVGSVIPFLRIDDFRMNFYKKVNEMLLDFENHQKDVKALRLLLDAENKLQTNIIQINHIRNRIINRYCKK